MNSATFKLPAWVLTCGLLAGATGCPDAVPGDEASAAPSSSDGATPASSGDGGTPATESGGASPSLPRTADTIASVSGNIAVGDGTVFVATKSDVVAVPKGGGGPSTVLVGPPRSVDVTASALFAARSVSSITVAGLDGSAPRDLSNGHLVSSAAGFVADGAKLFWLSDSSGDLYLTDTAASDAVTLLRDGDTNAPITHLASAGDALLLAIQACGGCGSAESLRYKLVRRSRAAGTPDVTVAEVTGLAGVVADGRTAFAIERGLSLRAFSLDGSPARGPITGDPALFDKGALALDAAHVYWLSRQRGQLLRAAREGGELVVFADGLSLPNEDAAYTGNVQRDRGARRIAVDDTHVYVSDEGRVTRFAK